MIYYYKSNPNMFYAVLTSKKLEEEDMQKLNMLFGDKGSFYKENIAGYFTGPRKEMITPWSTNAVEITQNMGIEGIERIEMFNKHDKENPEFDTMLQRFYKNLTPDIFNISDEPSPILFIDDIELFNEQEGLALNNDEIEYLNSLSKKLNRKLTDSEVFGFSQINSEHCRHKIFNGTFIIDGEEKEKSLFDLIKKTSNYGNRIVSAYKDNCAFLEGPWTHSFSPERHDKPAYFKESGGGIVLSLKAETHNFPTTVEPFNGAATGTGGEIRDRLAGGKGSLPLAGTAVYMTSYSRTDKNRTWEQKIKERNWLYQSPEQILIKASNGASDFGNKFGQPLICGSLLTFEHKENEKIYAYDKVIMLAGGIGFARDRNSFKYEPEKGNLIVVLGGDNYRIGMGGSAVSSVATGEYANNIEQNAIQRSNPEMQKRVANVIRAMTEIYESPMISVHDHGAGGHLNCLAELVKETGGKIDIRKLPIGDVTLSVREILCNESQERMAVIIEKKDLDMLQKVAERERAPLYVVGEITNDMRVVFEDKKTGQNPIDMDMDDIFGKTPKTILLGKTEPEKFKNIEYSEDKLLEYIEKVLLLENVGCKDWLTNKVDRSVTGKVVMQQTAGALQLPLNNCGIAALDFHGYNGVVTSIGHAPVSMLINPGAGARLAATEALTNLIWVYIAQGLNGISLSANWMWPAKEEKENARLYNAVEEFSDFCIKLGVCVPTGKDSLSMIQKYPDNKKVYAPGTLIVSTVAETNDIKNAISPVLEDNSDYLIYYINLSRDKYKLGGSSFAQTMNRVGEESPDVKDAEYFRTVFQLVQGFINRGMIASGHDISSGGMITSLLEMTFADNKIGLDIDLSRMKEKDIIKILFSENPGIIIQTKDSVRVWDKLHMYKCDYTMIGTTNNNRKFTLKHNEKSYEFDIDRLRDIWYKPSFLLDKLQSGEKKAQERYDNYAKHELSFNFGNFTGEARDYNILMWRNNPNLIKPKIPINRMKAAIIREKGVNGDREMAYAIFLSGMDVKDVHMTDLISGRENLQDVNMIVFVGGFSNSDVLGPAKGWANAFLYNPKANKALKDFYAREDTLSLGVCNGCQLMQELKLIVPEHKEHPKMLQNDSKKFESAFINVDIIKNNSVMLNSMAGMRLGIWIAHGDGKFNLPENEDKYNIPIKYSYDSYPANPNGSKFSAAAIASKDGRHLAMMPHLERSFLPWQWAYYPTEKRRDELTPWIEAFINAKKWIKKKISKI